jgi:pyridoxamine 5'-phosphate oxidase
MPPDAEELLAEVFDQLRYGIEKAKHGFHFLSFCNVDEQGWPQARTVVLRGVDEAARQIWFHTDIRSPKIAQLRQNPQAACLFYDREGQRQLRLQVQAELHHDDFVAAKAWKQSAERSRRCYINPFPPGEKIEWHAEALPDRAMDVQDGYAHFVVAKLQIQSLEILDLSHEGHQRVLIDLSGDKPLIQRLAP